MGKQDPKTVAWKHKRWEIDHIVDALGLGIDEGIKETVVALNLNGYPTTSSCAGHADEEDGYSVPWIDIASPYEPQFHLVGEEDIIKELSQKYNTTMEKVKRGRHKQAFKEMNEMTSDLPCTPEYDAWCDANEELGVRIQNLLDEYYRGREVGKDAKLRLWYYNGYIQRLYSGGKDFELDEEKMTKEDKVKFRKRLLKYQDEFRQFTEFLRELFFE